MGCTDRSAGFTVLAPLSGNTMASRTEGDSALRLVLIVIALVLLAPLLMMVVAVPMMGVWGTGMMGQYGDFGVSPLWSLGMMLVWLVVLVGGGVLGYRWLARSGDSTREPAIEELRLAYARGEITDEEFEKRYRRLAGDREDGIGDSET